MNCNVESAISDSFFVFPYKGAFYIALMIVVSFFILGCSQPPPNLEYFSFWKDYPELFGPEKWYQEGDKSRAEEERLFESKLADLFRKENLIPSERARAFLERFEITALSEMLFQSEIKSKIRISEKDLQAYYNAHPEQFLEKEGVEIGHIFIEIPLNASEELQYQAQQKIQAAQDELLSGASFEDVAKKYSEAESALREGRAGRLPRGQAPAAVEQAAFSLLPGQISPILRTDHGFHIIKVFSYYPEKKIAFDKIKDSLETDVRRHMEQSFLVSYILNIWESDPGSCTFYHDALDNPTSSSLILQWEGHHFLYSELEARAHLLNPPLPHEKWYGGIPMLLQREIMARQAKKKGYDTTKMHRTTKTWVENYVLAEEYMKQKVDAKVTFTNEELHNYYEQNREKYFELEKIRALVLKYSPELSDFPVKRHRQISEAKILLLGEFQDCKTSEQFREKAQKLMHDNPGDMNFYDTGLIVPAKMGRIYDMAMSKINPGELSDPLEDKEGLMLIFCLEKTPFRYLSPKEAEEKVKRDFLSEKCVLKRRKFRENLWAKKSPAPLR